MTKGKRKRDTVLPSFTSPIEQSKIQARHEAHGFPDGSLLCVNDQGKRKRDTVLPSFTSPVEQSKIQARHEARGFPDGSLLCVNDQGETQTRHSIAQYILCSSDSEDVFPNNRYRLPVKYPSACRNGRVVIIERTARRIPTVDSISCRLHCRIVGR